MEVNYFLSLLRSYVKPLIKEALVEHFANRITSKSGDRDPHEMVTTAEAMKMLGYQDRHSVYAAIKKGLPYVDGRPHRFQVSDIHEYLEKEKDKRKDNH